MDKVKKDALRIILQECFWGDYQISMEQAIDKLQKADPDFEKLITTHIIANSSFPSVYLRAIFSLDKLHSLLENINTSGRTKQRLELAQAVLFKKQLKAEPSWIRM